MLVTGVDFGDGKPNGVALARMAKVKRPGLQAVFVSAGRWGQRTIFIAVRKYRVRRGAGAEWTKRVQDSFVPLMRELKGFRGYYLLDGCPDVIITISMFDSAESQPGLPARGMNTVALSGSAHQILRH